jgi:hypothetical protein
MLKLQITAVAPLHKTTRPLGAYLKPSLCISFHSLLWPQNSTEAPRARSSLITGSCCLPMEYDSRLVKTTRLPASFPS